MKIIMKIRMGDSRCALARRATRYANVHSSPRPLQSSVRRDDETPGASFKRSWLRSVLALLLAVPVLPA
ncbi:MAG: hypothetical protein M3Q13_03675, partial [Pseudomonadota bacterium]|nr:hypothetical protein [Pseudomonadota bacterium]